MKKITTVLILLISLTGFSQNNPINFEAGGFGADWTWTVFENDTNPPLEIIANPDPSGLNTSATVAKFTALQAGQPFAGVESMHGADIGTFTLDASNATVKIMVWKSVISDVGIKFVDATSASTGEFKVANTLINQWEELTFDFSPKIGEPTSTDIDQIVIFPDFDARTSDNVIFFDSITFGTSLGINDISLSSLISYPNPVTNTWILESVEEISEITVYNIQGQSIMNVTPRSMNYSLDMTRLESGIYLIKVQSEDQVKTVKILKN